MWNEICDEAKCASPVPSSDVSLSEILSQIYEMTKCNKDLANKICEGMYGPSNEKTADSKPNINSAFVHLVAIREELYRSNDILHYILNRM